jgi:Tuberculosis necrotizing toxin
MTGIKADHESLRSGGGKLKDFGGKVQQVGEALRNTGQSLVSSASNDKSGVGAVVAKAMGKGVEVTGTVFKEGGRVAGEAADLYEGADSQGASGLSRLHPDAKNKSLPRGGVRAASSVSSSGVKGFEAPKKLAGGDDGRGRISGDLNDEPPRRDYDANGKTIRTDDLKHPQQGLLDSNAIEKANKMPPNQRASIALRLGVGTDHPAVSSIVPKSYDPDGGLGQKGWEEKYWPSGGVDKFGNRALEWPDKQTHPEGFESPESRTASVLPEGMKIDRFGSGFGRFTSPPGTPFPDRGLPPESLTDGYHQYEVVRPIPVWEGQIAEAMGQPGGGTQYYMPAAVVDLVNSGYLREVKP